MFDRFFITVAPVMNATNHKFCRAKASLVFVCSVALLFCAALVAAQSKPGQGNSNKSGKRQHVATLRSSDTAEGSRVAISSDQSLSDYEAYRRGDRFYVKLPAADVPRAEATRGRGFADVKVQRGADSTVVSFRLQPGTTAHVEQRSNKLDVVFNAPGAPRASATGTNSSGRDNPRTTSAPNANKIQVKPSNSSASSAKNTATNTATPGKSASGAKAVPTPKAAEKSGSKPDLGSNAQKSVASVATPTPVANASPKATPEQKAVIKPTPTVQPTSTAPAASSETAATSWQTRLKERARYWILLAQLNPIPIVVGAVILVLLILLFMFQRRRLKGTPSVRSRRSESRKAKVVAAAAPSSAVKVEPILEAVVPAAAVVAARPQAESVAEVGPAVAAPIVPDSARQARLATVAEQVNNVMAGQEYDEGVIGSNDRETRQLVGAELLSALVGRNLQRRERARAAFMSHGYFDDATRDLRIAEAPVERAAAARRLSFVHDREAAPHLIAALDDSAPEVRRTAVEALMDLRDPAAIAPLNALMQSETDRKVPRTLIKHAIEACATVAPADVLPASGATASPSFSVPPTEPEREVIEI